MTVESIGGLNKTRSAVIVVVVTVFILALGDAIIKGVSANLTLWQIFILRSVFVVPILFIMLQIPRCAAPIWPRHLWWTVLRSLLLTVMWVAYYASLPHLHLSVAAAAYYTLPLFITIFASLFLGDTISKTGWLAIALGFIGVLLVLQPRAEDFNWYALLPVFSAILYALAMIITRSRCKSESVLVLSLWLNLMMLFAGVFAILVLMLARQNLQMVAGHEFLVGQWLALSSEEWLVISVLSVAILVGSIGAAFAYQNGDPATIATFDFAYVAFAVLWGIAMFQETPDVVGAVGMLLIVIAGILAVRSKAGHHSPRR